jgi:hypothetical protein
MSGMTERTYNYVEYGQRITMSPQPIMIPKHISRWAHFLIAIGMRKSPYLYVELGLEKAIQRSKDAMALQTLSTPFADYVFQAPGVDNGR